MHWIYLIANNEDRISIDRGFVVTCSISNFVGFFFSSNNLVKNVCVLNRLMISKNDGCTIHTPFEEKQVACVLSRL